MKVLRGITQVRLRLYDSFQIYLVIVSPVISFEKLHLLSAMSFTIVFRQFWKEAYKQECTELKWIRVSDGRVVLCLSDVVQ